MASAPYSIRLLDHADAVILCDEPADTIAAAIQRAKYLLSDEYAARAETTHVAWRTRKVEVRDAADECVWDDFHPLSHDRTQRVILRDLGVSEVDDLGTSGLVDYVLGGRCGVLVAAMQIRREQAVSVVLDRYGSEAVARFSEAVAAERDRRPNAKPALPLPSPARAPASGRSR